MAEPGNGVARTVVMHRPALAILSNLNRIIPQATLNTTKINTLNSKLATEYGFSFR
jgi:hypothetical protein